MKLIPTLLPGCFDCVPVVRRDSRGAFVKIFQSSVYRLAGLQDAFSEIYYTVSSRNVLRGLHFQTPPYAHAKLICCVEGAVWDVALDLRRGSPTYGSFHAGELSANKSNAVLLVQGIAHGFLTLSDQATMMYHVTTEYNQAHDEGILWNSAGIPWPCPNPILSERDKMFVPFSKYVSPF